MKHEEKPLLHYSRPFNYLRKSDRQELFKAILHIRLMLSIHEKVTIRRRNAGTVDIFRRRGIEHCWCVCVNFCENIFNLKHKSTCTRCTDSSVSNYRTYCPLAVASGGSALTFEVWNEIILNINKHFVLLHYMLLNLYDYIIFYMLLSILKWINMIDLISF